VSRREEVALRYDFTLWSLNLKVNGGVNSIFHTPDTNCARQIAVCINVALNKRDLLWLIHVLVMLRENEPCASKWLFVCVKDVVAFIPVNAHYRNIMQTVVLRNH
jgi:hypothetical protein